MHFFSVSQPLDATVIMLRISTVVIYDAHGGYSYYVVVKTEIIIPRHTLII